MSATTRSLTALAALLPIISAGAASAQESAPVAAEGAGMSVVPFALVTSGDQVRPVVDARFNGHWHRMMIHSQASFEIQLRHAQATAFGVRDLRRAGSYGIEAAGKVSALGRSTGVVDRMQVGDTVNRDAKVAVFEIPQDGLSMLGIGWIRRNRVVLDYADGQAILAPTDAHLAAMRTRLLAKGYAAVPMTFDAAESRYTVTATLGGATRPMTVASASWTSLDPVFARAGGVRQGKRHGTGSGPTGTAVPIYALKEPLVVRLGEWTSPPTTRASILDAYAYSGTPRPAEERGASGGAIGSEFLVANGAVVDFGSGVLYLRQAPRG